MMDSTIQQYNWIFERMKNPSRIWYIASAITMSTVGFFTRLVIAFLNKPVVYNKQQLFDAATNRPQGVPLVTVSNHHSCFDDPGIWGALFRFKDVLSKRAVRWSLAAHDICFTNKLHSYFFMWGQCIPVIRGAGVYQPAIDLCIEKCSQGKWVHIFPEGKVNMTKEFIRLKWGVGRIIYESDVIPIIIPIWHEGMDSILANEPPYYLRFSKKVTINVGDPIDLHSLITDLKQRGVPEAEAKKIITDKLQDELLKLQSQTKILHQRYLQDYNCSSQPSSS